MSSRSLTVLALFLVASLGLIAHQHGSAQAQDESLPSNTEPKLLHILKSQIQGLNTKNPDMVLELFHPEAPGLEEMRPGLVDMFRVEDLTYSLDEHHYVGAEGPYAYVRVLQTTRGFRNGGAKRTEQLFVFKKAGKGWGFWTSVVLGHKPVNPNRPPPRPPK